MSNSRTFSDVTVEALIRIKALGRTEYSVVFDERINFGKSMVPIGIFLTVWLSCDAQTKLRRFLEAVRGGVGLSPQARESGHWSSCSELVKATRCCRSPPARRPYQPNVLPGDLNA
jgi:hypothetical protein